MRTPRHPTKTTKPKRAGHEVEEEITTSCLSAIRLGIAIFAFFGFQPVKARCLSYFSGR